MTIRQHIKRRYRDMLLVVAIAYAAWQVVRACAAHWPKVFTNAPLPLLFLLFIFPLAFYGSVVWFSLKSIRFPCPRCLKPMGGVVLAIFLGSRKIQRCPRCRVSLDEPLVPINPG